ncbi:MAG: TonB-dependent receptor [Saprospiraceae bacterium]|nr:TonB-dependent receptor [Saprospiraceae bacterium]
MRKCHILLTVFVFFVSIPIFGQAKRTIPVSGACGMCKDRIEKVALNTIGVKKANYNLEKQELRIEVQEGLFVESDLIKAILKAGHDAAGQVAAEEDYLALHSCCKYRDHDHDPDEISNDLNGVVYQRLDNGELLPLIGATVRWLDSGIGTVTNLMGEFSLPMNSEDHVIVVSYVGFKQDTLHIHEHGFVRIVMVSNTVLDAVTISHKKRTTEVSYLDPIKTQNISSKELLKAACCNLAESFDTTPAIDASVTDAVTGTRKIEMLGLAGPYVQFTRENIPDIRGLAAVQGLAYTPGPWIESMQLNMGAGSVVNGFESLTGQINVELRKPCHEESLHLNAYANQAGRFEVNYFGKHKVSDQWSTATLAHASTRIQRRDHNHDGFLDMPLGKQFSFVNRWKYTDGEGQEGQAGIKYTYMDNLSGQNNFRLNESSRANVWGADMTTNRIEFWAKRGFVKLDKPYKTLGFQFSGVYHDQDAMFGLRKYDATQKSLYFNSIYQTIIGTTDHQIRGGMSFQWDNFHEVVVNSHYNRNEWVPGIFGEYTYKGSEKFSWLSGIRLDYHNNFGWFVTPRLNIRYAPQETTVFRFAAGRGQRTESIFAENIGLFASSRQIRVLGIKSDTPYGLNAEVAWNVGLSVTQEVKVLGRNVFLSVDANRVDFVNQIVVDFDHSPQEVLFYNLTGQSYANSVQAQVEIEAASWLDVRLAYRYNDVQTTYGEQLLRKPLTSPSRAFVNMAFDFGKGWKWDYTINRMSEARIPNTQSNPERYRWYTEAPAYFISNTQISKTWPNKFELYLGGENIFDYRLHDPIIAADQPFSPFFDGSMVWAPVMGINIYAGLRFSL